MLDVLPKAAVLTAGIAFSVGDGEELVVIAFSPDGASESKLLALRLDGECHLHPTAGQLLVSSDARVAALASLSPALASADNTTLPEEAPRLSS